MNGPQGSEQAESAILMTSANYGHSQYAARALWRFAVDRGALRYRATPSLQEREVTVWCCLQMCRSHQWGIGMTVRLPIAVLVAGLVMIGVPVSASADTTGLAAMHAKVRKGSKICFLDHFHSGSGSGRTKKAAMRDAIQSWAGFTAFEYGTTWARYRLAASRQMACSRSGKSWQCATEARPCRRASRRRR